MRAIALLSILACLLWAPPIEAGSEGEIYEWIGQSGGDLIAQNEATNLNGPDERENIGDPDEEKNFNQEKF